MKDHKEPKGKETAITSKRTPASSQIVAADSIQAEEVPTIPLDSLTALTTLRPEVAVRALSTTTTTMIPEPLVVQPAEYRRNLGEWLHIWWDGLRPSYMWFAVLPLTLGSILAWLATITAEKPYGTFHPQRFLVALLAVCLVQLGANLLNDYYDYMHGIDTSNALGPGGLIQQGLIKPSRVLAVGLFLLLGGAFLGTLVAVYGGITAFILGVLGLLGAYFYSAPVRSLSGLTLGEVTSFWVFGPLLTLGGYVIQVGKLDTVPLIYGISLGLLISAIFYVNDIRDMESDKQAGKLTLATLLRMRANRIVCTLLLLGAYAPILSLGLVPHGPHLILITFWTLPGLLTLLIGLYRTTTPAALHVTMRQAIRLAVSFTALLLIALVITAYWHWLEVFALPGVPSIF